MRLFLAIELPEDVRKHLSRHAAMIPGHLGFGIAWTRPENLHVTVKFLGEVVEPAVKPLCEALGGVVTDAIPIAVADYVLLFPPRGPARVLAVGIGPDVTSIALRELHDQIDKACEPLGYASERREYRPHVTVGRSRNGTGPKRQQVEAYLRSGLPSPPFAIRSFALVQSRLLPAGPQYTRIASFELRRN